MLRNVLEESDRYFVRQKKEWTEILLDLETRNQYEVLDTSGNAVGIVSELSSGFGGFLNRNLFGSHRPLRVRVHDAHGDPVLRFSRPFFFLFSSLEVETEDGVSIGRVDRRFGLLYKKYDLRDESGRVFARIRGPLWRLWTFPVLHANGVSRATISKKWGGVLREVFADADAFCLRFEQGVWNARERLVVFAAAMAIDFDFFENNQK